MDADFALCRGDIPPVPTLNILCPKFCAIPLPPYTRNDLEPFMIVPLMESLYKANVALDRSWYRHGSIATLIFEERNA